MMKIDYELVEKIGATHYSLNDAGEVCYHKVTGDCFRSWGGTLFEYLPDDSPLGWIVSSVKPIPPKPPVRVEYELAELDSTACAYKEMLNGERFYNSDGSAEFFFNGKNFVWVDKENEEYTIECHSDKEPFYRRIEKPVDWRDEVNAFVNCKKADHLGYSVNDVIMSDECLLELCRIALRANGEL